MHSTTQELLALLFGGLFRAVDKGNKERRSRNHQQDHANNNGESGPHAIHIKEHNATERVPCQSHQSVLPPMFSDKLAAIDRQARRDVHFSTLAR
jgi:hypothetical protein